MDIYTNVCLIFSKCFEGHKSSFTFSKDLILCFTKERKYYCIRMTEGLVKNANTFILRPPVPLRSKEGSLIQSHITSVNNIDMILLDVFQMIQTSLKVEKNLESSQTAWRLCRDGTRGSQTPLLLCQTQSTDANHLNRPH